jgi:ketopantoate hydroxymethyltransferase
LLGLGAGDPPPFARAYARLADVIGAAARQYRDDVREKRFPGVAAATTIGAAGE